MYLIKHNDKVDMLDFSCVNIIKLLKFVLSHTYIEFGGNFYRQLKGVGTGSHTSPCYSEILIDYVYNTAIIMTECEPQGLSLYMDDCWLAWCLGRAAFDRFHTALNNVFPGEMVFTCEMEDEKSRINFLGLTIIRKENRLEHEFYQKESHSGKYLDYRSH